MKITKNNIKQKNAIKIKLAKMKIKTKNKV